MPKSAAYMRAYRARKKQAQQQVTVDPNSVEAYLGPKGAPEDQATAMAKANPFFNRSHSAKDRKYTHNCQRCVWATELRRRGYDVSAKPTFRGDKAPLIDPNVPQSFVNGSNPALRFYRLGSPWHAPTAAQIENAMLYHGEGARGALTMLGGGHGHVCNWEVKGGKAYVYDGQINSTHTLSDLLSKGFVRFGVARMDNIPDSSLAQLMKDFVRRSSDNVY